MRLLIVEDEPDLAATLCKALAEEGFSIDAAADGEAALWQAGSVAYDLIVLDLMMPAVDGWEVIRQLRARDNRSPILVLTARDATGDKVRALNSGADDYLTKPFTLTELVARIRAIARRAAGSPAPVLSIRDITIDTSARRVARGNVEVELTPREYALLEFLALHRGTLVTRSMLFEHVYDDREDTMSNVVDVYVASLRRKLGHDVIRTRRGAGYIVDG
jgi:two-component system OmpR family response regulator